MKTLFAALVAVLFCMPAYAQENPNCGSQSEILAKLHEGYGEVPSGRGVASNGMLLQITVNDTTGSWTIVMITPDKQACMVAAGDNWQSGEDHGI